MALVNWSYLYMLRMVTGNGPTKIGYSVRPEERLRVHRLGSPVDLELIWVSKPVPSSWEGRIHRKLRKYRVRGEWFDLTDSQIESLQATIDAQSEGLRERAGIRERRSVWEMVDQILAQT